MIFSGKITANAFYRCFMKVCILPFLYRGINGYDAAIYWENRHRKWGMNPIGAGSESFTAHENVLKNDMAVSTIDKIIGRENIDLRGPVLDIGCGSGLFTNYCNSNGVSDYTGMDITDVLFSDLKQINGDYRFIKIDITGNCIPTKKYKTIFMIDVIEHIVNKGKLISAIDNVKSMLDENGVFIVGPTMNENKKHFFYLHSWSTEFILSLFDGYPCKFVPFMCGSAVIVRGKHG